MPAHCVTGKPSLLLGENSGLSAVNCDLPYYQNLPLDWYKAESGSPERTFLGTLLGAWQQNLGHSCLHPPTGLPQTDKLGRRCNPLLSSFQPERIRCGPLQKPPLSHSHCCSGACLGDGAVVTTTVETALEEPEAVPCCRWDAGTVWMRTCVA